MASLVPFSYNEVYQGLAAKFKEYGYDIPYDGSNTAILCSILAYTAQSINFNTAVNINESLLTLAKKRKNVVRAARILSYEPKAKISTQLTLTLQYKKAGVFTIKEYQEFTIDGYTYYYVGSDKTYSATESEANKGTFTITVKQGTLIKNEDLPDELTYTKKAGIDYIDIPYDDVENDGLKVTVFEDDTDGKSHETVYSKKEFNFLDVSAKYENYYFRVDDVDTGNCRIYFKLGGFGSDIKEDSTIKVDVLRSDGASTNQTSYSSAQITGDLGNWVNVLTTGDEAIKVSVYGSDEEDTESIRQNAPLFYNTAGRCVTYWDYKAFLGNSSQILDGLVWGSEDELISTAGRIFYSAIPSNQTPTYTAYSGGLETVQKREADYAEGKDEVNWDEYNISSLGDYSADSSYSELSVLKNINYKNQNKTYVTDDALAGDSGIITTIQQYRSPGLLDYVRNPVYFNVDLYIDIKKYEQGISKGDIHQKIFEATKSYFEERLGFETNYVEATLIKSISEIVGSENGFDLQTFLSVNIDGKSSTMGVSKNQTYSSSIVLYSLTKNNDSYTIDLTLNKQCLAGDTITLEFNQNVLLPDGTTGNTWEQSVSQSEVIDENDETTGKVSIGVSIPENSSLKITSEINGTTQTASQAPVNMNTIYYTTTLSGQVCTITSKLLPGLSVGDKYELFYVKNGTEKKIENTETEISQRDKYSFSRTNVLTLNDILSEKIMVSVIAKNTDGFGDVDTPDGILIKFIKSETQESDGSKTTEYYNSERCDTFAKCQEKYDSDEMGAYDNYISEDNQTFLYTSVISGVNTIRLTIYPTKEMEAGGVIRISQNNGQADTLHTITADEREANVISIEIPLTDLKLTSVSYQSVSNYPMATLDASATSTNSLYREENDTIDFGESTQSENNISYTPISTEGGTISLVESASIEFYKNYINTFDLRNLVVNYGDEQNENLQIIFDYQSSNSNEIVVTHNTSASNPNIIKCSPTATGYITLNIILLDSTTGKSYVGNYRVNVIDPSTSSDDLTESLGGIHMYLDIPPEGIYTDSGDLIEENLPKFLGLDIRRKDYAEDLSLVEPVIINPTALHDENSEIIPEHDEINTLVYVDTKFDYTSEINGLTAADETQAQTMKSEAYSKIKKILPFYSEGQTIAKAQSYKWLRFPIYKLEYNKTEPTQIGTYMIVNDSVPYIRIKLLNSVVSNTFDATQNGSKDNEFEIIYPSSNFSFIKNSVMRLRSVSISEKPENYNLRDSIAYFGRNNSNFSTFKDGYKTI